jgi:hypothetical protein
VYPTVYDLLPAVSEPHQSSLAATLLGVLHNRLSQGKHCPVSRPPFFAVHCHTRTTRHPSTSWYQTTMTNSTFLGINPLSFSFFLFGVLVAFVLYLLLPRGLRVGYFGAYPKRYAWSARTRARRGGRGMIGGMQVGLSSAVHTMT